LGSVRSAECNIDSVAQSWSVLSGAGSRERTVAAMRAVVQRLVKRDAGLVVLLDPPFDASDMDPGYIRGYVPGVRENGGQYTHGAIWTAMAFAALRDAEHAWEIMRLINPINHGDSAKAIAVYRAEPYVVAADVYAVAPHTGRGGWSWYTGSAGWMYRLILEALLGVRREGDRLAFAPCLPRHWPSCEIRYRYLETTYRIRIRQEDGEDATTRVWLDDEPQAGHAIGLIDDRRPHIVDVRVNVAPAKQTSGAQPPAPEPFATQTRQ
jgi:cellobiose phosphorylase